jgi:formate hydrogenlyase subunit 6/NADH:ubiquinone oxidoreductase subunit I
MASCGNLTPEAVDRILRERRTRSERHVDVGASALSVIFRHSFNKRVTVLYPGEAPAPPRCGAHRLTRDPDGGGVAWRATMRRGVPVGCIARLHAAWRPTLSSSSA